MQKVGQGDGNTYTVSVEALQAEIARLTAALAETEARSAALVAGAKAEGMREAAGIAMFNHRQDYPWTCKDFADGYEVAQADICSAILAAAAAKEPKP